MTFPGRRAAIVGVHTTEQSRNLPGTSWALEVKAIQGALADAGLTHRDVDGLVPISNSTIANSMAWAEQLGGRPISFFSYGSGAGGVARAAAAIAAGQAEVVVIFYGNAGSRLGPQASGSKLAPRGQSLVPDFGYQLHGAYMSPWYALWTQRYMHQFNVPQEHLAEYSVIARYHATLNPDSLMGSKGEITVDDVFNSRFIAEPLHLLECSLDNDGGYAIVVASEEVAKGCRKTPVWVLGGAEAIYTDGYQTVTPDWIGDRAQAVRRTADIAFGMAGVSRDDIQVAGLYDCFPVTVARDLEEMGFCKLGEGGEYIRAQHLRLGGKMPTNTDGGLLSNSHNGNPSGMHVCEVTRQLRGECDARQVQGAKIGAVLSQGWSVHGLAATAILAVE